MFLEKKPVFYKFMSLLKYKTQQFSNFSINEMSEANHGHYNFITVVKVSGSSKDF